MRNLLRSAGVALLVALQTQTALAATHAATPLSLNTAIALALRDNLAYRSAQIGIAQAVAQLRQAHAPELPGLALRDTYLYASPVAKLTTPFGSIPFSSTDSTNVPLLALQYTLYDGGVTAARVGQAAAGLSMAEGDAHEARGATVAQVSKAYFGLLAAMRMERVAQHALTLAGQHVKQARELLAGGQIPRADLLRAQAGLADQNVRAIQAHDAVAMAQLALAQVLHAPLSTRYMPTDRLAGSVPHFDLRALLASARAQRGEYLAAKAALVAAQRAVAVARGGAAPSVALTVADGNTQPAVISGFHNQFSVGLSAVWMLFDGGYTAGRVAAARAGVQRAKLGVEGLREAIGVQVRSAYLGVQAAQAGVSAARQFVHYADESLRLAGVRYHGGVATALEMQDAQQRDRAAHQELVHAEAALRTSIVELRFAAGLL